MSIIGNLKDLIFGAKPEPKFSDSDILAAKQRAETLAREFSESLNIANHSKSRRIREERLQIAREWLDELNKLTNKFPFLQLDNLQAVEASMVEIEAETIKIITQTEPPVARPNIENTARNLLKEATALKKAKKYVDACDKLREAYSADGAENLMIADRLRLPMYLQLAGKNDEAWDELNRLDAKYVDQYSEAVILAQMSTFLKKENNETALNPVRIILRDKTREMDHIAIMQAARDANLASLRTGADICPTTKWLSVLGSHNCILCGMRDGKEWDTLTLQPVGHSIPFTSPPLHWNCRCMLVDITRLMKRADELGIGQRASMFGPVPRTTTFEDFLKQRDTVFQDGVLGEDRAKIWRDAKLSLEQLVDGAGRELTLDELRAKYC